jgi:hypothetical protein
MDICANVIPVAQGQAKGIAVKQGKVLRGNCAVQSAECRVAKKGKKTLFSENKVSKRTRILCLRGVQSDLE